MRSRKMYSGRQRPAWRSVYPTSDSWSSFTTSRPRRSTATLFKAALHSMLKISDTSAQDVMEDVLRGTTCAPLLKEVHELLARLAYTAHGTFAEFEDAVSRNDTRHVVHDGTVHPLTAYVINYVKVPVPPPIDLLMYRVTRFTGWSEQRLGCWC